MKSKDALSPSEILTGHGGDAAIFLQKCLLKPSFPEEVNLCGKKEVGGTSDDDDRALPTAAPLVLLLLRVCVERVNNVFTHTHT